MHALVVYESMFGNTRDIALRITEGLAKDTDTECMEVGGAPTVLPDDIRLLVVGGPTHAFGMSRERTREDAHKYTEDPLVSTGIGIREWIAQLSARKSTPAATFTTEIVRPRLPGSAAKSAAKILRRAGFEIVVQPETFFVDGSTGPVTEGELERAESWGDGLSRSCRELMV